MITLIAYAWLTGRSATLMEKARALDAEQPQTPTEGQLFGVLHLAGPWQNRLYIELIVEVPAKEAYTKGYQQALKALIDADKRISEGHATKLGILS